MPKRKRALALNFNEGCVLWELLAPFVKDPCLFMLVCKKALECVGRKVYESRVWPEDLVPHCSPRENWIKRVSLNYSVQRRGFRWPTGLAELRLYSLDVKRIRPTLPGTVTSLRIFSSFDPFLSCFPGLFPPSLTALRFKGWVDVTFKQGSLPQALKVLRFPDNFNSPLEEIGLPESLESLRLGSIFNQPLSSKALPRSLLRLSLGNAFKQDISFLSALPSLTQFRNVV